MLDAYTNLLLDGGDDGPPPEPFVLNESPIFHTDPHPLPTPVSDADVASSVDAAFAACRAVGDGKGSFGGWKARKIEVLAPGYDLFTLVHDNLSQLARVAREAGIYMTKAKEKNPALVCIQLGARPEDTDQEKLCSDWSTILRCALAEKVPVDGFIAWVGTTTVRACKSAVAEQQRAAKIEAGTPPRKQAKASSAKAVSDPARASGTPRLELHLQGTNRLPDGVVELPPAALAALFEALTDPEYRDEFLERMPSALHDLAVELATKGRAEMEQAPMNEPDASLTTMEAADG